jgi:hypothetical protein
VLGAERQRQALIHHASACPHQHRRLVGIGLVEVDPLRVYFRAESALCTHLPDLVLVVAIGLGGGVLTLMRLGGRGGGGASTAAAPSGGLACSRPLENTDSAAGGGLLTLTTVAYSPVAASCSSVRLPADTESLELVGFRRRYSEQAGSLPLVTPAGLKGSLGVTTQPVDVALDAERVMVV